MDDEKLISLEKRISTLETNVKEIGTDTKKILTALSGDELQVGVGLVAEFKHLKDHEVPELKQRVGKLEEEKNTLKNRIIGLSVGLGLTGGAAIMKLIEALKIFQ